MFKMCFHPSSSATEARWLPGQASAAHRKLMSHAGEEANNTSLATLPVQDTHVVKPFAASQQGAKQAVAEEAGSMLLEAGNGYKHAQPVPASLMPQPKMQLRDHVADNAAYSAAHPDKDAVLKPHLTMSTEMQLPQQVLTGSNTSSSRPTAVSDAIGDRIGRVALANEHRKVIRQELGPEPELSCPHYLVYVGTSGQLMQALEVSDFVPKFSLVPLQWPHIIEQMLVYTFAVSAALALINMAPIWYLDGEAALSSAIRLRGHSDIFYSSVTQPNRHWGRLLRGVLGIGSSVFVCVFLLHMVRLLGYDAKLGHLLHTLGKLLSFVLT